MSIEYASGGTSSPADQVSRTPTLEFETVYETRAPEFEVVLGVLVGDKNVRVQLGYHAGVVEESLMERLAEMYRGIVMELIEGDGIGGKVQDLKALMV
jgi:hypothetical protein